MIEAVIFDLDDTLHDDTKVYHRAAELVALDVARERGIGAAGLLRSYIARSEKFWSRLSSELFGTPLQGVRTQMWLDALREHAIDDAGYARACGVAYHDYRRDLLELWPGARELLAALRRRGIKLAMITNGFAETHREKIALLELDDAFDEILIADEVGLVKPDPAVFRLAARRLGVRPEACAMVGDRFDRDVAGGHAAGMFTVWMNVRGEDVPPGEMRPDATVTRIEDVEGVLPLALKR